MFVAICRPWRLQGLSFTGASQYEVRRLDCQTAGMSKCCVVLSIKQSDKKKSDTVKVLELYKDILIAFFGNVYTWVTSWLPRVLFEYFIAS